MKQAREIGKLRLQTRFWLSTFGFLFACLGLRGQSLRVSSVKGSPGETVAVEISLEAPAGKEPASLKWETVFPAQLLEAEGPSASGAAKDSGKSLTCATPKVYSYVCILAGGVKPVGNGHIATLRFKIRDGSRLGAATITIDHAEGISGDAAPMTITDAGGLVTIWSLHSATLSWVASTSTVVGYNVYRSTTSGGPYTKVNSTSTSGPRYTDSGVEAGQTYYYVITSVDALGKESEYSRQVTATIPSP